MDTEADLPREWVIDGYGGFEGLRLQDCKAETPGPTEIRLRVEAFALNWGDDDLMVDNYSFSFSSFPARAAPGRNILVPAGTSTAGSAALQIVRMHGATLISTTRSEANRQTLLDSGADNVFVDNGGDIEGYLREVTGGVGVHAAFDPVGGPFMERYSNAMAKGGMMFMYGGLSGSYSNPPFLPMIQHSLWFHAYSLFDYVEDAAACARGKAFVYGALAPGALKPNVDRVFPMEGYVDAWRYLRGARATHGKVVVETGT